MKTRLIPLVLLLLVCMGSIPNRLTAVDSEFLSLSPLKGKIKNNRYTAPDKSFSVAVPHEKGTYEYRYMQVNEQFADGGRYVSFGPAAFDQCIYRLEIISRVAPDGKTLSFDEFVPQIVNGFKALMNDAYGSAPSEIEKEQLAIQAKNAYHYRIKQAIAGDQSGVLVLGKDGFEGEEQAVMHEVYLVDFGANVVLVAVQIPEELGQEGGLTPETFAESVVVY